MKKISVTIRPYCELMQAQTRNWRDHIAYPMEYVPNNTARCRYEDKPINDKQREAVAILDAAVNDNGFAFIEGVGERDISSDDVGTVLYYWLDKAWS